MSAEKTPTLYTAPHMGYPEIWELAQNPKPELLRDYLVWVFTDDSRLENALSSMQWYPPGFHGLLVAINKGPEDVTHTATLRLNLYHPAFPGDEVPHAHSRDARSTWYAPKGSRQVLTRNQVVPNKAPRIRSLPVEERALVAMNIGDAGNGRRPTYVPTKLGRALIFPSSEINVAPTGTQSYKSLEVHHAGFESEGGVAISAYFNGPEEPSELSTIDGLRYYKGLSLVSALKVAAERRKLEAKLRSGAVAHNAARLAATTMLYPDMERVQDILVRPKIMPPTPEVSLMLLEGALKTAEDLCR